MNFYSIRLIPLTLSLSHRYGPGKGSDENGTVDVIKSSETREANPIRVTAKK